MTSNDDEDGLLEDSAIEKIARGHRDAVNIDEVERILESEDPLQVESYNELSPEKRLPIWQNSLNIFLRMIFSFQYS